MKEILETICSIAAFASLLAFIVGIFSPSTVKCKSRGQVALLYLFLFVVFVTISPHPDREIASFHHKLCRNTSSTGTTKDAL